MGVSAGLVMKRLMRHSRMVCRLGVSHLLGHVETLPDGGGTGSIRHHVKVDRGTRFHLEGRTSSIQA
jgi:hypothetical protein